MQTTGGRNLGAPLWPEDEAPREVRLLRPSTAHQSVRTVVPMRMNASPGFIQANDPPLASADPLVDRKTGAGSHHGRDRSNRARRLPVRGSRGASGLGS